MTKWQQAKTLMLGIAYLATGIALIMGMLMGLGPIMDWGVQVYTAEAMPLAISLIPALLLLVAIGWGAFFMHKSIKVAGGLFFYSVRTSSI